MVHLLEFAITGRWGRSLLAGLALLWAVVLPVQAGPLYTAHGSLEFAKPAPGSPQAHPDFLTTQVEILQTSELMRRSLELMRTWQPELKESEVSIRAEHEKNSPVIKLFASGPDEKYTRAFLEALMHEFEGFRKELLEKSVGTTLNEVIQDVLAAEKRVKKLEDERRVAKVLDHAAEMSSLETRLAVARAGYETLKKKMDDIVDLLKVPPDVVVKEHSTLRP